MLLGQQWSLAQGPGTFPLACKISSLPVFKHPLYTSSSKILISWDYVGCSLCSSEDWLGDPVRCTSKWAQLPLTSPPSSYSQWNLKKCQYSQWQNYHSWVGKEAGLSQRELIQRWDTKAILWGLSTGLHIWEKFVSGTFLYKRSMERTQTMTKSCVLF